VNWTQAVDYTHTSWDGYGQLMIFTCPPLSTAFTENNAYGAGAGQLMVRLLGQLGVGEPGQTGYGWTLRLNGDNLWYEHRGTHRNWSLVPKVSSG
jgi:hypothetical protein